MSLVITAGAGRVVALIPEQRTKWDEDGQNCLASVQMAWTSKRHMV